ncbi:MAG: MerR family transcriptional regulator [Ruminococcaceae bacterium]|nr:MerR family transcriptional regulator [Oscillospiraceae bacterium]
MRIKAVCERTGLTDRTVRYYIEEGLISPSYTENYLGRKTFDFSEKDISDLNDIAVLRAFGFSVEEIRDLLLHPDQSGRIIAGVLARTRESLCEDEKRVRVLSSLDADREYTISDLATELSSPESIEASDEDVKPNVRQGFARALGIVGVFAAVWSSVIVGVGIFLVLLGTREHPVINPLMTGLCAVTFLPSVLVPILSRSKAKRGSAGRRVLLGVCVFCIPLSIVFSSNSVSECKHEWSDFTTELHATCSEEGSLVRNCTKCTATDKARVEKLPHTEQIDAATDPTCTKTGLSEGVHCSVCGEVLTAQSELPMINHIPKTVSATEATCTESGLAEGSECAICGKVLKAQEIIPLLAHTPETDAEIPPTCTRIGLTEGSHCAVCDTVLTEQAVIPRLAHRYTVSKVAATCGDDGYTLYTCECGHSYKDGVVRPTQEHDFKLMPDDSGYMCSGCRLVVCEYGLVSNENDKVKYYLTGVSDELDVKRTLVIYGDGDMPDFTWLYRPPWEARGREIVSIILEPGITSMGEYAFYSDYDLYEGVKFFVICNRALTIAECDISISGIPCRITYYFH